MLTQIRKQILFISILLPVLLQSQIAGYQNRKSNGFDVNIQSSAIDSHKVETNTIISLLQLP